MNTNTKLFFRSIYNSFLCLFSHRKLLFVKRLSLSAELLICDRCGIMLVKECDCGKIVKWKKVKHKYKSMS
jgi:hypothetical protein